MVRNNRQNSAKWQIIFFIFCAFFLFFYFGGQNWLTFDSLKQNQEALKQWADGNLLFASSLFFVIYVTTTALSFPGAAILTLASGLIFGFTLGTLLSSFASTLGAGLAFLTSRYLLKNWVQSKFGDRIHKINDGLKTEGAYYLFTLRLVPIFPFFLVNFLMGLTAIKFWTYYIVSQVAMLPATAIYVNAGTQLSEIESPKDILSLPLIISFVLLGLFPLLVKKIMNVLNSSRNQTKDAHNEIH